jgi:putative transposase
MRIRQLNHSVYQIQYHIIWTTKYRRKILKEYVKVEVIKSLYKTQRRYPDWYFYDINTDQDHIHIRMEIPPKYTVAEVIQKMKAESSQEIRRRFKFIDKIYGDGGIWSVGYFVSTIGLNEEVIKKYIERQGEEDRGIDVTAVFSCR